MIKNKGKENPKNWIEEKKRRTTKDEEFGY